MEKLYNRSEVLEIIREYGYFLNKKYNPITPVLGPLKQWFEENYPEDEEVPLSPELMPYLTERNEDMFGQMHEEIDKYAAKNSLSPEEEIILFNFRKMEL